MAFNHPQALAEIQASSSEPEGSRPQIKDRAALADIGIVLGAGFP
ncbi:hypothetical protein AAII07_43380 [Microvirga sp. 0TCS3.31]